MKQYKIIILVFALIIVPNNELKAKGCRVNYRWQQIGPDSETDFLDLKEITFVLSDDFINNYDMVGFPSFILNQTNMQLLDMNQDGYSDQDFVERIDNLIIWKSANGSRRITTRGCGSGSGFNPDCGYAFISFKRKPHLISGSGNIEMHAKGILPNGEEYRRDHIAETSFFDCPIETENDSFSNSKRQLALVIGNANYLNDPLSNPINDAHAMSKVLENLRFEVITYENVNQSDMKRAIDEFGQKLKNYDVGLFFYSGHGVQVNGENYLIPVDANPRNEADIEYDGVNVGRVLAKMKNANSLTNIVILDACRDNPFEKSWTKSLTTKGLTFMNAPTGSIIAYATAPGKVAYDDSTKSNSFYTAALLDYIGMPNISILEMFQQVRTRVIEATNGKQTPWESTSLTRNFYFKQE
ncbi:uncharacterized protein containing caspase domain-protein [Candidatus Vecturithrix granuli]|uniref:Uncharacterized protein containing caspase domain-protein n=1 Tax=Vecturithrix granuli TaxID=1499967 RepID=A0A081BZ62_VECG1|nr:uncharacterized protein containing caspase domain-protein [Candidatus Vecturithrix granuli]